MLKHVLALKQQIRDGLTDEWQTVSMLTKRLHRADDSAVLYRVKQMVGEGVAEGSQFVNRKSGRIAWHFRSKVNV